MDLKTLSDREREVLELALAGRSAREMAERLTLTEATIRSHLARIYAKLGVAGRVELLARINGRGLEEAAPPTVEAAPPARRADIDPPAPRRRRRGALLALSAVAMLVAAGALLVWSRSAAPTATDLSTASQLIARGQVASLEERDDTLFVTTVDARNYRVDNVDQALPNGVWAWAQAQSPRAADTIQFTSTRGDGTPFWVEGIAALSVVLLLAALLLLTVLALATLRRVVRATPTR